MVIRSHSITIIIIIIVIAICVFNIKRTGCRDFCWTDLRTGNVRRRKLENQKVEAGADFSLLNSRGSRISYNFNWIWQREECDSIRPKCWPQCFILQELTGSDGLFSSLSPSLVKTQGPCEQYELRRGLILALKLFPLRITWLVTVEECYFLSIVSH